MDFWDSFNYGKLTHHALHENRAAFENLIQDFLSSRPYYSNEGTRFLGEVDRVLKPYIYTNTPVALGGSPLQFLELSPAGSCAFYLRVPDRFEQLFIEMVGPLEMGPERGLEHDAAYCQGMLIRVDTMVPKCASVGHLGEAPAFQFN